MENLARVSANAKKPAVIATASDAAGTAGKTLTQMPSFASTLSPTGSVFTLDRRHSTSTSSSDMVSSPHAAALHLFLTSQNMASREKLKDFFGEAEMGRKLVRKNLPSAILSLDKAQRFFGEEVSQPTTDEPDTPVLSVASSNDNLLSKHGSPQSLHMPRVTTPLKRRHSDSTLGMNSPLPVSEPLQPPIVLHSRDKLLQFFGQSFEDKVPIASGLGNHEKVQSLLGAPTILVQSDNLSRQDESVEMDL
ncbi:hypothetical protein HDV03_003700 [Kappamyces sp. JEL0829]|nr:hypothetical protein HDV03_003700 [Kappamyces sp. JEL0829]